MRITRQFCVFAGVGIACTVIDVCMMKVLLLFGLHHIVAATVGFLSGLVANFLLHTRITFNAKFSKSVFVKFMMVVLINYLLTIVFVSIFDATLGMAMLGKYLSLPVVAVNGFLLSKFWIYR